MRTPSSRQLWILSGLAVLACAAVYVVALGTAWGLDADARAVPGGTGEARGDHVSTFVHGGFQKVLDASIALGALAVAFVGWRHRPAIAAVSIGTLIGATATVYALKPLLANADPLGGEAARSFEAAFPSGHATAATAVALAGIIAAPPEWRARVMVLAAGFAVCVGVALVALAYHYPSDVIAGYLVAGAWAAATTAIAVGRCERRAAPALR